MRADRRVAGDTRALRAAALLVFLGCGAALVYMHRGDIWPAPAAEQANLNPDFVACRDARTATVDQMLAEGMIDEQKHTQFTDRAAAVCASEFPVLLGGN